MESVGAMMLEGDIRDGWRPHIFCVEGVKL